MICWQNLPPMMVADNATYFPSLPCCQGSVPCLCPARGWNKYNNQNVIIARLSIANSTCKEREGNEEG